MSAEAALQALPRELLARGYRFITTTPLSHQRVLARRHGERAGNLRDVFGWSLPFDQGLLDPDLFDAMTRAGVVRDSGGALRSTVRVSTLADDAFLHSAYPTLEDDAVFFGPDTYRFARFIAQELALRGGERSADAPPLRLLDVGCGSGAGALAALRCLAARGLRAEATLNDINPRALQLAAANFAAAGLGAQLARGDALEAVDGTFDLVISNPPYMADPRHRAYRDGGAGLGRALSVRIAAQALSRLAPGGQLLLYTGVAMIDGADPFLAEMKPLLRDARVEWSYSEIDPDVFGEELEAAPYDAAERIAAVGLVATRRLAS
nr:methyltransferase [Ramlibacter paludis]